MRLPGVPLQIARDFVKNWSEEQRRSQRGRYKNDPRCFSCGYSDAFVHGRRKCPQCGVSRYAPAAPTTPTPTPKIR